MPLRILKQQCSLQSLTIFTVRYPKTLMLMREVGKYCYLKKIILYLTLQENMVSIYY